MVAPADDPHSLGLQPLLGGTRRAYRLAQLDVVEPVQQQGAGSHEARVRRIPQLQIEQLGRLALQAVNQSRGASAEVRPLQPHLALRSRLALFLVDVQHRQRQLEILLGVVQRDPRLEAHDPSTGRAGDVADFGFHDQRFHLVAEDLDAVDLLEVEAAVLELLDPLRIGLEARVRPVQLGHLETARRLSGGAVVDRGDVYGNRRL